MKVILLLLLCLRSIPIGTTRKCYACSSYYENETCSDSFNKEVSETEICDLSTAQCVKEKTRALSGGKEHFFRGCVSPEYCKVPQARIFCETCDEDECNTSSTLPHSLLAIPFLFILIQLLH